MFGCEPAPPDDLGHHEERDDGRRRPDDAEGSQQRPRGHDRHERVKQGLTEPSQPGGLCQMRELMMGDRLEFLVVQCIEETGREGQDVEPRKGEGVEMARAELDHPINRDGQRLRCSIHDARRPIIGVSCKRSPRKQQRHPEPGIHHPEHRKRPRRHGPRDEFRGCEPSQRDEDQQWCVRDDDAECRLQQPLV